MKSRLSALKFVRNNKKQVWVMVTALSLTFMAMYMINFLLMTTQESFEVLFLEQPKKVAYLSLTPETMKAEYTPEMTDEEYYQSIEAAREHIVEQLKQQEGIRDALFTQCMGAGYQAVIGQVRYDFPLLDAQQIPAFVEHMDARLIAGNMPRGEGEVLIDEKILKNGNLKLGDYLNEAVVGQIFRIVGVIESPYLACVGTPCGYTNSGWYIVVQCDENSCDMTKALQDIGIQVTEYDAVYDAVHYESSFRSVVTDQLEAAVLGMLLVVMVFLTVSILVAYISFMRSRVNEYCLYTSIGFSRRDIYEMMMREIGLIFGISFLLGAVITVGMMLVTGHLWLDELGLVYRYFYPEQLLRILAAFAALVGFLQFPILTVIHNIRTVDRIEE